MEQIGRYQVTAELGKGAMGVVYQALDPAIGRTVAIKTIRPAEFVDPAEQDRLRERLLREARSAGILSHPGIVTIYDVAEEQDLAYIAMEFVSGPTLEQVLSRDQPPDRQTILRVWRETAAALDYAHKKGIVHRDIKPANIMIREDGVVKITDFGVAKDAASQQMTHAGTILGTPNYMSPEQIQGKAVDGRSDQFSLAVIAYEMLTGEKPFSSEQLPTLLYKIVHDEPPSPQRLNPTLAWQVEVVLRKALEKDPDARYRTCTEFARAIEGACNSSKGWKPLPRGGSTSLPTVAAKIAQPREQVELLVEPEPKRRWSIGKVAAIAGVLAIATLAALNRDNFGWLTAMLSRQEIPPPPIQYPAPPVPSDRPSPTGFAAIPPEPDIPVVQPPEEIPLDQQQPPVSETAELAAPREAPPSPPPKEAKPPAAPRETTTSKPPPREQPVTPSESTVLVRTSPPNATVVFDSNPRLACKSPCSLPLTQGRHTVAATLTGHRPALRIFEVPREVDLFLYLARMSGQVQVLTTPPGASIIINGQQRREKTPVTLELPVGKYTVAVAREGYRRDEQEIEVKDNAFLRLNFTLGR